jgi:hypothetical protein
MLAARFLLSILFKYCMHLLRRRRRLIRKKGDITGMILLRGLVERRGNTKEAG